VRITSIIKVNKHRDPFIISFLFVLILAGSLLGLKFRELQKTKIEKPFVQSPESVSKIEIQETGKTATLEKKENLWLIKEEEELPAEAEKVNKILEALKTLTAGDLVSENEDNYQKLGVASPSAIIFSVFEGEKQILKLFVGNAGPDFEKDYIRLDGEKKVFLSNLALRSLLSYSVWKNKKITSFKSDEIKEATIIFGSETKKLDAEKGKDLINALTGLTADDAVKISENNVKNFGFEKPEKTIELLTEKEKIVLKFGTKTKDKKQYLQKNNDKIAYLLSLYTADKITETLKKLL